MNNLRNSFSIINELGYFDYGYSISKVKFRRIFGIEEIEYPALRSEVEKQTLEELGAADYCRNKLLNEGKYLKGERDSYRVLLPSENASQVLRYMRSADGKLKRGIKLNLNTPSEHKINSSDEVRAVMKLQSIQQKRRER